MSEKQLYQCTECGLHYEDEETMKKCEAWCRKHKSCNLSITRLSEEATSKAREALSGLTLESELSRRPEPRNDT